MIFFDTQVSAVRILFLGMSNKAFALPVVRQNPLAEIWNEEFCCSVFSCSAGLLSSHFWYLRKSKLII